ncbi:MAG: class I SAM-dependent methyltransferase [Alphaproteobacteria bacterium]
MTLFEPAVIETLLAEAEKHGFEESCAPETGALLRTLAASKPRGRLLNLGTGFGVSSAWLLEGMSDDAELWTVDIDATGSAVAKAHLDERLRVVVEDAKSFLEGAAALGQTFDLIFADAMPGKYEHRDLALDLVAVGGFYVVDDLSPTRGWTEGAALAAELADQIEADPRFVSLSLDWSTGHLLAVRVV